MRTMLDAIAHREDESDLYPGHPVVCALDLFGLVIMLLFLALYPQKISVAILPISIAALYIVSCLYHWQPHNWVMRRLDHLMIAVVIAVTYIPFWANLLPMEVARPRFWILATLFSGVWVTKLFFFDRHALGGIMFFGLGLYGTVRSLLELLIWLPTPGLVCFWLGAVLYTVQLLVYSFKWPDPQPKRLGFREVQHLILVFATTLQTWAVMKYV